MLFKASRILWIVITTLSFANLIQVSVKKGDTFNTILRKQHINHHSIDQINASLDKAPIISSLSPHDTISLYVTDSNTLISAYIQQKNQDYVLNKHRNSFRSHPITHDSSVKIVSTASGNQRPTDEQILALRASQMLFPKHSGHIHAAIKDGKVISIKVTSDTQTNYAFLQETNAIPVYIDIDKKIISPAIARSPTNYLYVASPFNLNRLHPISKKTKPHTGVDLAAPINTPIWAAADGVVIDKSNDTGYGNLLIIQHDHGIETRYAHLNKFHHNISIGQKVNAFETIGYVGSTGVSTGNHLHFEIRIHGKAVDPLAVTFPKVQLEKTPKLPYYF